MIYTYLLLYFRSYYGKCNSSEVLFTINNIRYATKRYRTTLWLVHNLISNIPGSAKENGCTPRMETKVGTLCSQDWKIQQKEVSRHYLTPEMVPGKIRHFLVASFYSSEASF